MGQDPLPASRSCHGNHEGKEGMEWKVSRVPDHHGVAAHRPNTLRQQRAQCGAFLRTINSRLDRAHLIMTACNYHLWMLSACTVQSTLKVWSCLSLQLFSQAGVVGILILQCRRVVSFQVLPLVKATAAAQGPSAWGFQRGIVSVGQVEHCSTTGCRRNLKQENDRSSASVCFIDLWRLHKLWHDWQVKIQNANNANTKYQGRHIDKYNEDWKG
jgi:hypothetical protein